VCVDRDAQPGGIEFARVNTASSIAEDTNAAGVIAQVARPPAIETVLERRWAQCSKTGSWGAIFVLASASHPAPALPSVSRPRAGNRCVLIEMRRRVELSSPEQTPSIRLQRGQ
jgi:hypothetical protein